MAPQSKQARQTTLDNSPGKLKPVRKAAPSPSSKSHSSAGTRNGQDHGSHTALSPSPSPTKPIGGIRSFFNKAAQKAQDNHRPVSSRPHASPPNEDVETITSDEDNHSTVALSKGSSTALAVRKRRFAATTGVAQSAEDSGTLPASQKFRKLDSGDRVVSSASSTKDGRPWTERFGPATIEELAVHKRKVDDVRGWLETAFRTRRNKALILKGPAGAGKTATIKLVARALDLAVVEWSSPTSRDLADAAQSYSSQFEDFMLRSGRSSGLVFSTDGMAAGQTASQEQERHAPPNGKHFLLVEDFPNTYFTASNAVQSFRSAIAQHLATLPTQSSPPIPLVFVISETSMSTNTAAADSFTTHRLLGPELAMHSYIDTIEFNPIAPTFLLKALDQIVLKEARVSGRRYIPGRQVLKRLAEFGDIRSAVSTLEFLLSRDGDAVWSDKVAFTKAKKKIEHPLTTQEESALEWISSRASSLDIFHSVGKVVYNKRTPPTGPRRLIGPPPWLPQHRRPQVPENDVNDLVTEIGTETGTFIAALHENYLLSCSNTNSEAALDSVSGCIENLSDSDLLYLDRFSARGQYNTGSATETLRQDEIAFQLGVRGVLFSLPMNVKRVAPSTGDKRDAFRMFYPASAKLWKHQAETESALDSVLLALHAFQLPAPAVDNMRERLYSSAGVRPHADVSGETEERRSATTSLMRIPKAGLMLECLPSVYTILQIRDPHAPVLGQLRRVIRMSGFADSGAADEEAEDSQQAVGSVANQWATDKSDDTASASSRKTILSGKRARADLTRPSVSVEKEVASLVLEDDDIEDD